MGMIDYSGWFQPIPESPVARGLGSLTKSIQAIVQRRQLQQQHEAEQKGLAERAQMEDARQRQLSADRIAQDQADLAQRKAQAEAQAAQQKAQLQQQRQQAEAGYWKDAQNAYDSGAPEVGDQILQSGGLTRRMDNIEDISMEDMLDYPVAPRGPRPPPGAIEPGNVDLYAQPEVKNPDGTTSTVHSFSVGMDGKEVLLPTVTPDGRHLSQQDALGEYDRTGRHLGMFGTPQEATAYAEQLHNDYASGMYKRRPPPSAEAQAEDAQTQTLYDRFGQQGLIRPDGSAEPFNGPPTLALRARRAQEAMERFRGRGPLTDEAIDLIPAAIGSGIEKPEQAGAIYTSARDQQEANKRNAESARAAAVRQQRSFERPMSPSQEATQSREDLKLALTVNGVKASLEEIEQSRNLIRVAKLIEDGNWAAVGTLKGMFSKNSQGGTGVLTDKDLNVFWTSLKREGVVESTWDGVKEWYTNKPTPEKLQKVKEALASAEAAARRRMQEKAPAIANLMRPYEGRGHLLMKATLGYGFPEIEAEEMKKAIAAAKAAKGKAAGGKK